jgi:hypothetical protein
VILAGKMASSELWDATRGGRTDIEEKHKPWEIASTLRHAEVPVSWGRSAAEAVIGRLDREILSSLPAARITTRPAS